MIRDKARLRATGLAYLTGGGTEAMHPLSVGTKFDPTGAVLPFAGNTFLCHVDPSGKAHAALVKASLALQAGPLAGAFSFLPPSSFHMTVFEGVCDLHRDDDRWPARMPPDLPLSEVCETFARAGAACRLPRKQTVRTRGIFGGFSVALSGADAQAEATLRNTRRVLREVTAIRRGDFDSYDFHITLAYLLRWLNEAEAEAVLDLSEKVFADLSEHAPEIELGPVEFCRFADMHEFKVIGRL